MVVPLERDPADAVLVELRAITARLDAIDATIAAALDVLPMRYRVMIRGALHGRQARDT